MRVARPIVSLVQRGRLASRTRPLATSLPASLLMATSHSCRVRPCCAARASTCRRPSRTGRTKSVKLSTPTAYWPRWYTAAVAPTLAAVSTAPVYTAPCTMPIGW